MESPRASLWSKTGKAEQNKLRCLADITKDVSNIKVYYANVGNSLLSKMEECIISEFSYDIIAVNEVKPYALNLNGYDLFTSDLR